VVRYFLMVAGVMFLASVALVSMRVFHFQEYESVIWFFTGIIAEKLEMGKPRGIVILDCEKCMNIMKMLGGK